MTKPGKTIKNTALPSDKQLNLVKQNYPELRISETAVRRILAEWQPRNSGTILRFERSTMTEEEVTKYRSVREQAAAFQQQIGPSVPLLPDINNPSKTATKFVFGFGERPNYPSSNRKVTKDLNLSRARICLDPNIAGKLKIPRSWWAYSSNLEQEKKWPKKKKRLDK
jgi:hypothetical protein